MSVQCLCKARARGTLGLCKGCATAGEDTQTSARLAQGLRDIRGFTGLCKVHVRDLCLCNACVRLVQEACKARARGTLGLCEGYATAGEGTQSGARLVEGLHKAYVISKRFMDSWKARVRHLCLCNACVRGVQGRHETCARVT